MQKKLKKLNFIKNIKVILYYIKNRVKKSKDIIFL